MVRMASYWLLVFLVAHTNEGLAEDQGNERNAAFSKFLTLIVARNAEIERRAQELTKLVEISIFDSRANPDVAKKVESGLKALRYAVRTDESTLPTLSSDDFRRVTLGVDPSKLVKEIESIINFCLEHRHGLGDDFGAGGFGAGGRRLFPTIKKDANGPSIDVGKELIPLLGQEWIMLNDPNSREFQWLIAISLKDKQRMIELLTPLLQNNPDAEWILESHWTTKYAALNIVNDWLLVGSPEFVDSATAALH